MTCHSLVHLGLERVVRHVQNKQLQNDRKPPFSCDWQARHRHNIVISERDFVQLNPSCCTALTQTCSS